jgi:hypothetical protein
MVWAPLQGLKIGARSFRDVNEAWDHIQGLKQRLLGRYVGPGNEDFE